MRKKNFLRICILVFLIFAGFMDLGILVIIGSYEPQFFWMYLLIFGVFYTLGGVGTYKEKYSLLYIFAAYIILSRFMDIAMRTMDIVKSDHSSESAMTSTPRTKRDILIKKDGNCCVVDFDFTEEYIIPSCCHDDPTRGDPISEACRMAGYGTYAYKCEDRSGRKASSKTGKESQRRSKAISFFAIFYCVRTIIDVTLLFFVFLLAYILQYKK